MTELTFWRAMTAAELETYWTECAALDRALSIKPSLASPARRAYWEGLDAAQLRSEYNAAWLCNERERYCLAATYLERATAATQAPAGLAALADDLTQPVLSRLHHETAAKVVALRAASPKRSNPGAVIAAQFSTDGLGLFDAADAPPLNL